MRAKTRFSVEEKLKEGVMVQGLIKTSNLKQKDVAELLGYEPNDISQWWSESNPTRIPDATFVKLGEILGFNPVQYRPWLEEMYVSLSRVLASDASDSFRTVKEIRHDNFLALIEKHGSVRGLAEKSGRTYNYLTGVKCQHIPIGDKAARAMEEALCLPSGWMDNESARSAKATPENALLKEEVNLKQALKSSGLTAAELSRRVGASPQTVNGWLKRNRISSPNLFRVAESLGLDPKTLTGGTNAQTTTFVQPNVATARELWSWMIKNNLLDALSSEELFKFSGMMEAEGIRRGD